MVDRRDKLSASPPNRGGVDNQKEVYLMSRRQLRTDDEDGFLLAFYDDMTETEALYHVKVKVEIKPSSVRGKVRMIATAWKDVGKPTERAVASFESNYPTASAARLHAALYRMAIGIGGACSRAGLPYRFEDSEDTVA